MSGTHSDAPKSPTGYSWQKSAVLSDAVLEPLYALNWEFLTIVPRFSRQWRAADSGPRLPDPVWAQLLAMRPEQVRELARCPFSLFSARFEDETYWEDIAAGEAASVASSSPDTDPLLRRLREFAQLALFYAWHLALSNPGAARVILGMTEGAGEVFRHFTLIRLQQIAQESPLMFEPRWPSRPVFWHTLLSGGSAEKGDRIDLRLLGLQILAADYDASSGPAPTPPLNRRLNRRT